MRTGLREDFVEVFGGDSLLVNPVLEKDVEESANYHLFSAAAHTAIERRTHDKPGRVVGHPDRWHLQQSAAIEVDLGLVFETVHFVLGSWLSLITCIHSWKS